MTAVDSLAPQPGGNSGVAGLGIIAPQRHATAVTTAVAVADRTVRKFVRTPQLLVLGTIQSALFLLIFRYVFGGAIHTGDVDYVDFMVPGFIITGTLFSGLGAAAGMAEDIEQGFFDRLRSLPVSRLALLTGRAAAETALVTWGLVLVTVVGFVVGFRLQGSILQGLAAFGLAIIFGFAWVWLFLLMGLMAGNAQAAQNMSMLIFPLTFVSSAYVPVDSMPGWMQTFANNQPITAMANAARSLTLGDAATAGLSHSTTYWVLVALAWAAGIAIVFAPLAVLRYRRS